MHVEGGRFALQARIGREDHFPDRARRDATDQILDMEVLRPHTVEGREASSEHVVQPSKFPSALDGADVRRLLDDADQRCITTRVTADRAQLTLGEVEAALAGMHTLTERGQSFSESSALLGGLLQEVIGQPESRLTADAWELGELGREIVDNGQKGLGARV